MYPDVETDYEADAGSDDGGDGSTGGLDGSTGGGGSVDDHLPDVDTGYQDEGEESWDDDDDGSSADDGGDNSGWTPDPIPDPGSTVSPGGDDGSDTEEDIEYETTFDTRDPFDWLEDDFGNLGSDDNGGESASEETTATNDMNLPDVDTGYQDDGQDSWEDIDGGDDDSTGGLVGGGSTGGGTDSDNVRDSSEADEYIDDPRQDPDNWQSDSGDASDVIGGGRVAPEDDEWAQAQDDAVANVEEQVNTLIESLPTNNSDGSQGGISPMVALAAVAAVAGGAYLAWGS
ncbi:hypothetical protein GJ633_04055 [Halorubrum sp. CBA1125]|uniref:hypothetical protein n=1 Tax=Halorubrum sp. CBA1125 TaxID=2668072 RepID=UPI0012E8F089|nr:hypothetical protein [Halorubrum sp. CBA1125]MUW13925.1 hypothetical protein [Halorubrum sp. CBA1125]